MTRQAMTIVVIAVMLLASFLSLIVTGTVRSQETYGTLSDALNWEIGKIDWNSYNSWTALWGNIFSQKNLTAFDQAISRDIANRDYLDALYVARLAHLNNYTSPVLETETKVALENVTMAGSLPITSDARSYGDPGPGAYLLYDRYLLYSFAYAEDYGLTAKWNLTQAYLDFKTAYNSRPSGSQSGEMLWIDPAFNWSKSYSSRYFDEHAETMSVFLEFADLGISEAMNYTADAWENVQAHWNGKYYGYTGTSTVECEMGNFAELAGEYKDRNGSIPYWDRVISDLDYKLLTKGWSSPGWAQPGVIVHATTNPQLRLWETTSVIIALQQFYPYFTQDMKGNFTTMLMGNQSAWKGLLNSSLNFNGTFAGMGGNSPSNEATTAAAVALFLEGIVPVNGSLAIPFRNEQYEDYRTPFNVADFKFDYNNHSIRIPVNAGTFTFIYGSTPVSYTFPSNGTYNVRFSSDWNSIVGAKKESDNESLNLEVTIKGSPILSWNYSNASPTEAYQVYRGVSPGSEESIAVTNSLTYIDSSAVNGNKYYYQIVTDEKLTSNEVFVIYDYAPEATAEYDQRWHAEDFLVTLSAPQDSGAKVYYQINNGSVQNLGENGQPLISTEGPSNILEYWSESPLGLQQSDHIIMNDLKLDKTMPTVTLTINNGALYTTDPMVTLEILTNATSGITQMRFRIDDAIWSNWTPYVTPKQMTLTSGYGLKELSVEVQSGSGKTATASRTIALQDIRSTPIPTVEPTQQPKPTVTMTQPTDAPTKGPSSTPAVPEYGMVALIIGPVAMLAIVLLLRGRKPRA